MEGTAYTFFTTENARLAKDLINILREATAEIPAELEEMAMMGSGGGRGKCRTFGLNVCGVKD
jgi:ATP-dependent RNA helicase DDX5/DBP2